MPLEKRTVEIVLRGVEQSTDDKTRPPDALAHGINVVHDKDGALVKRRGYQVVHVGEVIGQPFGPDEVMLRLVTRADELLVITHDHVLALGSKDEALRGTEALTYRGPNNRGHVRLRSIWVSTASAQQVTE